MLRDYQQKAVDATFSAWDEGNDFVLCVLATGCGKTVIFASVIERFLRENPEKRVMVLAHREELIRQAAEKVHAWSGHDVAVEMGEEKAKTFFGEFRERVVVSTVQTQISGKKFKRCTKFNPQDFGLVVVDEAHHAPSRSYIEVLKHYRQNTACKVLGVTATPDRADEESMGKVFQAVAADYDVGNAIADGWLTPVMQHYVKITGLDFSAIKTTCGDLNNAQLADVMEEEKTLYGIADATRDIVKTRKTLIFAASVAQAKRLSEILNRYMPDSARAVDGKLDKQERRNIIKDYSDGKFQFLVNCAVFTEGFDVPDVAAVVMARPTKSRALYAQMLGRGTRPDSDSARAISAPNLTPLARREILSGSIKPDCLVVDFVGNSGRHRLISSLDILGGCGSNAVDDETLEIAKKKIAKANEGGREMPTQEAIEQARAEARAREIEEARQRAQLRAKATYSRIRVDPFDAFGIQKPQVLRGWDNVKKPSLKQREALEKFGIKNTEKMKFKEACQLLDECVRRAKNGEPSFNQIKLLQRFGITAPFRTREAASRKIGELLNAQHAHNEEMPF